MEAAFRYKNTKKLRLYRNLVAAAVTALQQIFDQHQLADRVVSQLLRSNKKWGSKDRRFLANTIYELVRWYRLYYEILGQVPQEDNDWWRLIGIHWCLQGVDLPDWTIFEELDATVIQERYTTFQAERAIAQSIPDWLDALGQRALVDQWSPCLQASNEPAAVYLRVNTLRQHRDQVQQTLAQQNIEAFPIGNADALQVQGRAQLTTLKAYQKGAFEIQDAASQRVAPYLDPEPGMTVVDACAGAGGKTLHLAALMHNRGQLTALDIHAYKLRELQQRARRAGASIVRTQVLNGADSLRSLIGTADRLLLDVPCSGLGTLRRSPQIKWRLQPDFLTTILQTQQEILATYAPICKVGGRLCYATCSILPQENQEQVQGFLDSATGAGFRLLKEETLLPQFGFDGFYMGLLERVE